MALPWFEVLACYKLGIVLEGTTPIVFCLSPDPEVQRTTYQAFSPAEFEVTP